MPDPRALIDGVRARAETPYTVAETPEGFEVNLDFVDARWYAVAYREAAAHHRPSGSAGPDRGHDADGVPC